MESQYNLAYHYARGKGVRVHERKAAYWLLQAARQGDADGAYLLGVRYIKGQGTKKDVHQGMRKILEALDLNHPALGLIFLFYLSVRYGSS